MVTIFYYIPKHIKQHNKIQVKTRRAELPFLFLSNEERKKLRVNRVNPLKSPKLELLNYSLYRQTGLPRASIPSLRQRSLPGHGARVWYSLSTNVNTPFFQVPKQEFGHGAGTRVQGRNLVLRHKSGSESLFANTFWYF